MPNFHPYQQQAIDFLLSRIWLDGEMGASLQLDPGLGKTLISLETVHQLKQQGVVDKVLIVAPLRVIHNVWPRECAKWGYPFTISIVHGNPKKRLRALENRADLYLINREGVRWLSNQPAPLRTFSLLLNDESTSFKNWMAKRTRALYRLLKRIPHRINLTGTPTPNSLEDWFAQQFIVDEGEALGRTIGFFREWAMRKDTSSYMGRAWVMDDRSVDEFYHRIGPSTLCMKCEDHLDMPPKVDNILWVELPAPIRRVYDEIEEELFAELDNGENLIASTAAAKYTMLRQISNGGCYQDTDDGRRAIHVHDSKVDAVEELMGELQGKPLLCAFQFDHDYERLKQRFPSAPVIKGGTSAKDGRSIEDRWNEGSLPLLLVQPQALSHGANLQAGGRDLAWVGHTDQPEAFQQLNARLWRQGQTGTVRYHHIMARDTVDQMVWERLQSKEEGQRALMLAMRDYRKRRTGQ